MKTEKLFNIEIEQPIIDEIYNNIEKFHPHVLNNAHYNKTGALRNCKSIYFLNSDIDGGVVSEHESICNNFIHTYTLLKTVKNTIDKDKNFGKAYLTIIPPNGQIYPHKDLSSTYFLKINRYQIYIKTSNLLEKRVGSILYPTISGDVFLLEHTETHEYINQSNLDILLLVFDLFI